MACSLFGICLSLFLEQKSDIGRIIALDEAHKYMTDSAECKSLTESLLATIRLQRHLGARVVISTQEPTISPRLLDLCSTTLVHRFTSPDWLEALKKHLAGASSWSGQVRKMGAANNTTAGIDDLDADERDTSRIAGVQPLQLDETRIGSELFHQIVHLHPGEALLFSPSAVIGASRRGSSGSGGVARSESGSLSGVSEYAMEQLGRGVLKVRIRQRVTKDGGLSVMASAKQ
ncbi:Archaeal DNA helicase HerA [Geosmithia morbida]|uniref:Archaeal DNA helicase HerA n=1 Tax=Geosmithia morbida TaxID=1094350 RepID=A0A9P4Z2L0_9HYPO|nr:Archaeal DNA helicase HerA [Geosmithia morbida]KAF4125489.1 Archaeal DNA helicase HerA [Geosmithia morbida]